VKRNCECHPWTDEDWKVWQIVKKELRTRAQWEALHDAIERYRRLLIDDYKRRLDGPSRSRPQEE
jgi:hypothetical protein